MRDEKDEEMKAKDTVMTDEQIAETLGVNHWSNLTNGQLQDARSIAKISFKAGQEFAEKAIQNQLLEIIEASKKTGKKEVVEFWQPRLNRISECVSEIQGDWSDPRSECKEISKLIDQWESKLKEFWEL